MQDPQKPDASDLEEFRKIALEERKFDFEIQKYKDAKLLRDRELAKLNEELRELTKPWWRKATYLSPVATITVAILGGILAFGTDVLKSNVSKLIQQGHELSVKNGELSRQNSTLSKQIGIAQMQIKKIQAQESKLEAQLPLDRFQALLSVLERKAISDPLELSDPTFQAIYQAAIDGGSNSGVMRLIEGKQADPSCSRTLRAGFSFLLFKISGDPKYKRSLAEDSMRFFNDIVRNGKIRDRRAIEPYITILADRSVFNLQERTKHLKQMYAKVDISDPTNRIDAVLLHALATWGDEDSLVLFRDPWVRYLWYSYTFTDNTNYSNMGRPLTVSLPDVPSIASFSPEAFAIQMINFIATDPRSNGAEIDAAPGILSIPTRCPFPSGVPLCSDFIQEREARQIEGLAGSYTPLRPAFVVSVDRRDDYRQWISNNKRLVELFLEPAAQWSPTLRMNAIRVLPDKIFRKVLRREWITKAELRPSY